MLKKKKASYGNYNHKIIITRCHPCCDSVRRSEISVLQVNHFIEGWLTDLFVPRKPGRLVPVLARKKNCQILPTEFGQQCWPTSQQKSIILIFKNKKTANLFCWLANFFCWLLILIMFLMTGIFTTFFQ